MEKRFKMFKEVAVGDALAKSGRFPKGTVTLTKRHAGSNQTDGNLYQLDLDNGDTWWGWADRKVELQ
jgi:hypothetical protein